MLLSVRVPRVLCAAISVSVEVVGAKTMKRAVKLKITYDTELATKSGVLWHLIEFCDFIVDVEDNIVPFLVQFEQGERQ